MFGLNNSNNSGVLGSNWNGLINNNINDNEIDLKCLINNNNIQVIFDKSLLDMNE